MTTFLLIVSLVAVLSAIAAIAVFAVKKIRNQWIPPAVFAVWVGGATVALFAHVALEIWSRVAMNAVMAAAGITVWALHQAARRRA